jgi:hypothetical protein
LIDDRSLNLNACREAAADRRSPAGDSRGDLHSRPLPL